MSMSLRCNPTYTIALLFHPNFRPATSGDRGDDLFLLELFVIGAWGIPPDTPPPLPSLPCPPTATAGDSVDDDDDDDDDDDNEDDGDDGGSLSLFKALKVLSGSPSDAMINDDRRRRRGGLIGFSVAPANSSVN